MNINGIVGESPANTALGMLSEIVSWAIGEDYMGYIQEIEEDYGITLDDAFRILKKAIDKAESM